MSKEKEIIKSPVVQFKSPSELHKEITDLKEYIESDEFITMISQKLQEKVNANY